MCVCVCVCVCVCNFENPFSNYNLDFAALLLSLPIHQVILWFGHPVSRYSVATWNLDVKQL